MAGIRFADMQSRPTECLDFTSLTLDEFQQLVPALRGGASCANGDVGLDGKPRTARQFAVYKTGPLNISRFVEG